MHSSAFFVAGKPSILKINQLIFKIDWMPTMSAMPAIPAATPWDINQPAVRFILRAERTPKYAVTRPTQMDVLFAELLFLLSSSIHE